MSVLVLTHEQVESLMPMNDCLDVMAEALAGLTRGESFQPLRPVVRPPGAKGFMGLMPAWSQAQGYGLKVVCIFPDNPARGLDAHQGAVLLFDAATGETRALMNASAITAIRTAAVSGVATRLLAREDSTELAILGAGVQARSHLQAMACAGRFERARIWSRTRANAERVAAESEASFPVEVADSVEEAVRDADVVCTTTSATEPVVRLEWLKQGAHVNAVGASVPTSRELDSETMAAASLFVDRRESAEHEAGEYVIPMREGAIREGHIRAELGEVIAGTAPGRTSERELTVFKSLGLAVEDLAAATYLYERAQATGVCTLVDF